MKRYNANEVTLRAAGDDIRVIISSYRKHSERRPRFSMCVVNSVSRHPPFIHSFIHIKLYQMLPQIYSITMAFHLRITNHAFALFLVLINSISNMISTE